MAHDIGWRKALSAYKMMVDQVASMTHEVEQAEISIFSNLYTERKKIWPAHSSFYKQHGIDLGDKMFQAFEALFQQNKEQVLLIGSDCPTITATTIQKAYEALDQDDVVFGPSTDGGYYLVGMKKNHPSLFLEMVWSTESVLEESLAKCDEQDLSYSLLEELTDIDTVKDWEHYLARQNPKKNLHSY